MVRLQSYRIACLIAVLLMLGIREQSASAAEEPDPVLVLSVEQNGRHQAKLTKQLSFILSLTGATLVDSKSLRNAERTCVEPECLYQLAQRFRAALIVGASIELTRDAGCYVSVWLFDSRNGRDRKSEGPCEPTDVEERLKELAGSLIVSYRELAPSKPPPPPPPPESPARQESAPPVTGTTLPAVAVPVSTLLPAAAPIVSKDTSQPGPTGRSALRKGLAGTFITLAGLSLASAITLNALNGTVPLQNCTTGYFLNSHCLQNFTGPFAAAYAASGALLVSAVLTLTVRRSR